MSLTHLLLLLSAAGLGWTGQAGLVSSTTEEENIPLEQSPWTVNTHLFFDDGFLESGRDIVFLKDLIEKLQELLKNGMEPSIRLNVTGLDYVRGYHTM